MKNTINRFWVDFKAVFVLSSLEFLFGENSTWDKRKKLTVQSIIIESFTEFISNDEENSFWIWDVWWHTIFHNRFAYRAIRSISFWKYLRLEFRDATTQQIWSNSLIRCHVSSVSSNWNRFVFFYFSPLITCIVTLYLLMKLNVNTKNLIEEFYSILRKKWPTCQNSLNTDEYHILSLLFSSLRNIQKLRLYWFVV